MPKIHILLPVHNRKEITRNFVVCLKAQTFVNYQLILIDDGSSDGTAEMVREYIPSAVVVTGKGSWWWAGSLQQGIDWLHQNIKDADDIVLMINDDVAIGSDFIETGVNELQPGTLLQATVCCDSSREILDVGVVYDDKTMQFLPAQADSEINCLTTNGLFVRWKDLIRIGNFYPRLLPHYLSDYEFTIRAGRKGLQLSVSKNLNVWWNRQTTGSRTFTQDKFPLFWRSYFSRKSALNPVYWSSFVFLVSKPYRIPMHLMRIWKTAVVIIFHHALSAAKAKFNKRVGSM